MDDAAEKNGMKEVQRLYPDVIYRFNSQFQMAWENLRKSRVTDKPKTLLQSDCAYLAKGQKNVNLEDLDAIAIPVFFSKSSRTFHWIGVGPSMWDWGNDQCTDSLRRLIHDLRNWNFKKELQDEKFLCVEHKTYHTLHDRQEAWENFLKDQPSVPACKEAIETIKQAVNSKNDSLNWEEMHRAILILYSGFHQNAEEHIEGVFYQFLQACSNQGIEGRSEYLEAELDGEAPFKTLKLKEPCESLGSECGSNCIKSECKVKNNKFDVLGTGRHLDSLISFRFLEHLLLHKESSNLNSLSKKLENKRHIALLPLYDLWIRDRGYGGIKAVFLVYFDSDSFRKEWIKKKYPKLRSAFPELSEEVRESAETLAASLPIIPPYDLVRHFLAVLTCVQDWESAAVFEDGKFQFAYERKKPEGSGFKWDWEIKQTTDFHTDQEPSKPEPTPSSDVSILEDDLSKKYMWWTAGENGTIKLWSKEFIPGLSDEEVNRFGSLSIRFEFPKATHVPLGSENRKLLYQEYLREQLDLMRMLIPKIRARRNALRSAVSAIMGRNMSHNIGSHVLARYSSTIKHDLDPADKEKTDHRTDFLSYLQRRMDFLAEVATSDMAFWEQPLSLKDALSKLNYKIQADRIALAEECKEKCNPVHASGGSCKLKCARLSSKVTDASDTKVKKKNEPILLSYITGKESLVASVEWGNPPDTGKEETSNNAPYFSCPGGEVGVHALYVILENIIRNSARHAKSDDGKSVDVYVSVADKSAAPDNLIKLTIIDPRTRLEKDGCVTEQKKSKKRESLTAHINEILTKEPFLNEDGSTNPKYWGVREMQICAHYLRGLPLGDLEGKAEPPCVLEANPWEYVKDNVTGYYLSYTLYLKRAQLLAYIETSPQLGNDDRDKKLLSRGIKPIYRDKVNKKDNENKEIEVDWQNIADESRGYSFLVLSPDLKSKYKEELQAEVATENSSVQLQSSGFRKTANETQSKKISKHALPVRVIEMGSYDIKELIETAGDRVDLRRLHEAMIKKYRTNGQGKGARWGKGDIYAVSAWFGKQSNECEPIHSDGSPLYYWSVNMPGDEDNSPFSRLPSELPVLESDDQPKYLGLAWLDHANDDDLMKSEGGNPLSASFTVGGARNWASVEPLWSDSPHRQVLIDHSPDGMSELAAAALARVVVLDERIQSRRHDIVRAVTLRNYWPQAGIWCPLHPNDVNGKSVNGVKQQPIVKDADTYHKIAFACDLDEPIFDDIHSFLNEPTKVTYQWPADFLVLHLTILERLNKQRPAGESINKTIFELVHGTQCEHAQIIIVTGRGVPTVARHRDGEAHIDARYLPISALQEFLVTRPSKLGLMRVLWAAAAPSKQS